MTETTEATVTSFEEWQEGWPEHDQTQAMREKHAKAVAESVMDPRAVRAARQAAAPERKTKAPRKPTRADDVAAGVKKHKAAEAENLRRAQARSEVEAAARAKQAAQDEQLAQLQRAAVQAAPRPPSPAPKESANPLVRALRAATADGQVGRLSVDIDSLPNTLDEFACVGYFAREGRFSTAAVMVIDREPTGLGVLRRDPGRVAQYTKAPDWVVELDAPNGHAWLATEIAEVRSLPTIGELADLLVVVTEQCVPADLSGLKRLAAETRACIALVDSSAEHGWVPVKT